MYLAASLAPKLAYMFSIKGVFTNGQVTHARGKALDVGFLDFELGGDDRLDGLFPLYTGGSEHP